MILTFKVKHNRDFSKELALAKKIAEFGLNTKSTSSKDVKHIGLKSAISNQILRKYSRNKKLKRITRANLTIPNQSIQVRGENIYIPCLKLTLDVYFNKNFEKINQIELNNEFAFVSVTYEKPKPFKPKQVIGVDRNTTGHVLVASNINTGKVLKLGKQCNHIHNKYKSIRKILQEKGKYGLVKRIKHRESNIVKNINHQISKKLVVEAKNSKAILVLEDLKGIRQTAKTRKKQRYALNSWSFYQLNTMIEYKSKKQGVTIAYVEPQYTSQRCSKCGHISSDNRKAKQFHCTECGMVENADVNAGFNIAYLHQQGITQFSKERDLLKGNTDTPKKAMV